MKRSSALSVILAFAASVALVTLMPVPGAGQGQPKGFGGKGGSKGGGKGKGGGGGGPNGVTGPYFQAPVVPGGPVGRTAEGKPDMQGFWTPRFNQAIFEVQDHSRPLTGKGPGNGAIVDPADGRIPYKPEAAAKAKDLVDNHMYLEPEAHCYMSGVPHSAYQQYGYQILQSPGYFVFETEYAHSYRIIPTDGRPHISPDIKLFMGDSVGKWVGDTLVIDTTNQNGKTWFDMAGNFTTQAIHVVERITPVDSNLIDYEATIEDPTIYTQPWKIAGQLSRHPDKNMEIMEFACYEGNQDLHHYTEGEGGTAKAKPQ
jgi:hypothetical protein